MKINKLLLKHFWLSVFFCIGIILFFSWYNTIKDDIEKRENMDTMRQWCDNIDIIYYINLERREDRKQEILEELHRMGVPDSKIIRIDGIYKEGKGDWGCSLSHLKAMREFNQSKYKNCIIFEDDFMFQSNLDNLNSVFNNFFDTNIDYDVCMLSANGGYIDPTEYPFVSKINGTQTASGYMVNHNYSGVLLKNYEEGSDLIGKSYDKGKGDDIQGMYCVDQYWKRLQDVGNWYIFQPKIGIQRDSFSDIQGGFVSPGV
jgi:glycosyl transferase family 25